eukprot:gene39069-52783_t
MPRHIAVIQGHPDGARKHLCHGLADAYAEAALKSGHRVTRIEIAAIDFPLLRDPAAFNSGAVPASLQPAVDAIAAADHVVLLFPLWLGTVPALLKAFLEQVFRPGVAFSQASGKTRKLLAGRSAHLVVTMGMPAWLYQTYFCGHGIRGIRRNIFKFVGFSPVRTTLFGMVENASDARKQRWYATMRRSAAEARAGDGQACAAGNE